IMTRPIWDLLTQHGGRSLLVNIPTTYPPEPLNGVMITGMLTPGLDSEFTYPQNFKEEMLAGMPAYVIEPGRNPDRTQRIQDFIHASDMHELAVHFLMDRGDWDFLMVVFSILDRAQHDFWADMDSAHPRHDPNSKPEFRGFIHEMYERLDASVGRIVEKLPPDVRVLIVSDHGFCSELMEIRVNEALAAGEVLSFKSPDSRKRRAQVRSFKEKVTRRLGFSRVSGNVLDKKVSLGGAFLDEIDWSRTRAYFAQDKGVWVNLKGREAEGVVVERDIEATLNEVRQILLSIKSPEDGEPVFEKTMTREQAFHGEFSNRLPDMVMVPHRDDYVYNERPSYGEVVVPADSTSGTHSRDGIFIAWGKGVKAGADFVSQPQLRDVAPTALHSLGCPMTEDMDARSVEEIFADRKAPGRQGSSYRTGQTGERVYTEGEEAELRKRLQALGYIE
ncbi:MAG: alkaline phosphatase family protein, partial [Blastocatellia bacterium]